MPVWLDIIKLLPKAAAESYKVLSPEAKIFLEKAVPAAKGRMAPILNVAEKSLPETKDITGIKQVLYPLATQYQALSSGIKPRRASEALAAQFWEDTNEMTLPLREMAAKGRVGEKYEITRPVLPSSVSPIKYQADVKKWQERKAKAEALGRQDRVDYYDTKLQGITPLVKGQKIIQDLPVWLRTGVSPVSTKTREAKAFDAGTSMVADKAAAITWQDGFIKNSRAWWRSLTGAQGPGAGFKNMGRDKAFQVDMANLVVDSWPQTEKYYSLYGRLDAMVRKYKAQLKAGNEAAAAQSLESINKFKPQVVSALTDLNAIRKPVMAKYFNQPDVRIALYREPETRAWVESLMSPGEKAVAENHKWLMEQGRDLAETHGIPVLNRDKEYVTHLLGNLSKLTGRTVGKTTVEKMKRALPAIMRFQQRSPGSLNFFPSIQTSTEAYLPMLARKVAETAVARKWTPHIKNDLKYWPHIQKALKKDLEQFLNKSMDENFWEKAMRQLTWWTYFTKVGLSVPVAVKHAIKFGSLIAMHPRDALPQIPRVIRAGAELALQRFGVKPGPAARIIRNHVMNRNLYEDVSGLVGAPEFKNRAFAITNLFSGMPVNWVEALERGTGVLAAMNKASRTGVSFKKMQQGIWGTILDNSFLGRADNFLWLNRSWQRFMAIFAYTPGMIIDRTLRWAMKGTTPERFITGMKSGILESAWRMPRDVFGTTYTKHLIAFLTTLGAAEMYAQYHGVKPWWVLQMGAAHLPSSITRSIPIETMKTAEKRGGTVEDWASTLFDFMSTIPALDKAKMAWQGKLPKAAGGSEFFAATGIPSAEAAKKYEELQKKFGGRTFGSKWERKHAIEKRKETVFGPLYEEAIAPWLRRP